VEDTAQEVLGWRGVRHEEDVVKNEGAVTDTVRGCRADLFCRVYAAVEDDQEA